MYTKTKVLEIHDLYKLIPEAKKLEHTNFANLKDLLEQLITAIEYSGKWEFIQYITNKPSLFIIREKPAKTTSFNAYDKPKDNFIDIPAPKKYDVKAETKIKPMQSSFPEIKLTTSKLPWED